MIYAKIQPKGIVGSGDMGMAVVLFPQPKKAPFEQNRLSGFRGEVV